MGGAMGTAFIAIYFLVVYLAVACGLLWGWLRWSGAEKNWGAPSALSFSGFGLATSSALLAVGALVYGHAIGGFPHYDPRLMRIYRWGSLLSMSGIIVGLGGVWRKNALRWHSPLCAAGMLIFWLEAAASE
jgi:hypothetical protein